MAKTAYLTIDDGPTAFTPQLLAELKDRSIPAVLFFIGERMQEFPEVVISAIQQGFIIGNHSWSHPHFDKLSLADAKDEICRTDQLIDQLYQKANVLRTNKYFRFPYGDIGDGRKGLLGSFSMPWKASKGRSFQDVLKEEGYQTPNFQTLPTDKLWQSALAQRIDWSWSFDIMEWSLLLEKPVAGIQQPSDVINRLVSLEPVDPRKSSRKDKRWLNSTSSEVILIHDNPDSAEVVLSALDRLTTLPLNFQLPVAKLGPN